MDVNNIIAAIGSVGFPVVACVGLYLMQIKQADAHKQEMDKVTEAINNNTIALTRLIERIGGNNE